MVASKARVLIEITPCFSLELGWQFGANITFVDIAKLSQPFLARPAHSLRLFFSSKGSRWVDQLTG